jgi:hypothetical protein
MASVNFTAGLKVVGDRTSSVAGAGAAITGMSTDDNTSFTNTDTTVASTGGTPAHFQGNALDSTPTGGAAATPYVVAHLMTLTTGQYNTFTVKRIAVHNSAAPTNASATLILGVDGFSLVKQATFSLITTFKASYS